MIANKTLWGVMVATTAVLLTAACGSGASTDKPGTDNSSGAGSGAQETASPPVPVELVFYDGGGDWPEERFQREIAEPLRKKFPHLTPTFVPYTSGKKVEEMLTAGQQLDVIFSSTGLVYHNVLQHHLQYDITPLIQKHKYDLNQIEPMAVDQLKQLAGGGMYGLPVFMSPSPLYYNKDIFDKFGVGYPKDGMTWDDLYALSRQLTREEGGVLYRGFFASVSHLARLNQSSIPPIDPTANKAVLDTDGWKSFMDNIVRFYQLPGYKMDGNLTYVTNKRKLFIQDKTVAMWLPVSTQHTAEELAGLNWDIASFPIDEQRLGVGPQPYPNAFWLTTNSKHKDEAFQAIAYLASESFQLSGVKRGEFVSALKSDTLRQAFGQETELYKGKNRTAMLPKAFAPAVPITRFNSIAESQLLTAFNDVILGKKDVNTALRIAEEAANKKIQEELAK